MNGRNFHGTGGFRELVSDQKNMLLLEELGWAKFYRAIQPVIVQGARYKVDWDTGDIQLGEAGIAIWLDDTLIKDFNGENFVQEFQDWMLEEISVR